MQTGKYNSPLKEDNSTSYANKGKGWKGLKGQAALALAVSLWIAGSGLVSAQETIVASDYDGSVYGNHDDNGWDNSAGDPNNNQVTVKAGVTVSGTVYGSNKYATTVSGNTVIINGKVTSNVYGGNSGGDTCEAGDVNHNHVTITGTVGRDVYGGRCGGEGDASENEVTVSGGAVGGSIYGGYVYDGDTAGRTRNQVTLKDATVTGAVYGFSVHNGAPYEINNNTLNLSGVNTVGGSVKNFNTIKLMDTLTWNATDPVLTAGSFENYGTLDITAATKLANQTAPSTMTLLSSDTDNNFNTIKLSYNTATQTNPVTLNSSKTSQVVKSEAKTSAANGVTLGYNTTHTVSLDTTAYKNVSYTIANSAVNKITLGTIVWNKNGTARALTEGDFAFNGSTTIDTSEFEFTAPTDIVAGDSMTLLSNATGLTSGDNISTNQSYTNYASGIKLNAALTGNIIRTVDTLSYTATGNTLNSVDLANWTGNTAAVPDSWTSGLTADSITAAGFTAPTIDAGASTNILTTTTDNFFNDNQITGAMKYAEQASSSDTVNGVTLTGAESKGVKASDDGKSLLYARSNFNVKSISLGEMAWRTGRDASGAGYDYTNAAFDASNLTFNNPESITAGTTTLFTANKTLAGITDTAKNISYGYSPVDGVTVNGLINGSYSTNTSNAVVYTATDNKATKLTFGNVEWKDTGALIDHATTLYNVKFAGADVNTANINFTNIQELAANKTMTLVSDFGDSVGTITGTKYKVGSTLQGNGSASLVDSDNDGIKDALIFTAETAVGNNPGSDSGSGGSGSGGSDGGSGSGGSGAESGASGGDSGSGGESGGGSLVVEVQPQAHNTVMGAAASVAALSAGNDFIGGAADGLALVSNTGADGMATYANVGGGTMRQETGSHVNAHLWNAILAVGHKNEKTKGDFEYGAFLEYGTGNYSTHNGNERGDGSTKYTGGGLLAKYSLKNGTYVEGSLRAGRIHDDASNLLRDAAKNPRSYTTDATYWGFHLGVGRELALDDKRTLDLYGKYFYNRRGSVSFNAGGQYNLDAVSSKVLRLGTRYTMQAGENWKWYGGLAYEHEFGGAATGTADGLAIRGADVGGGSVRGELGATMQQAGSPWSLDVNVSGFAGKKQGLAGSVAVKYSF